MTDASPLAATVARAVAELSPPARRALIERLRAGASRAEIEAAIPAPGYAETAGALLDAWKRYGGPPDEALALAIECAAAGGDAAERVSLVWTGPTTAAVAPRRTDQALLQVINTAQSRVIVVSFAVYRVPDVASALVRAAERGARVDLILESEAKSGGKVGFEMRNQLGSQVAQSCRLYTWAAERRPQTPAGTAGSLHAKCAVADGRLLLVSSANLTEYAQWFNIELGLLVEGGEAPVRAERHWDALMKVGELQPETR
jgi:phosphatidylserine/phosphatidylglycerophosphate/cardiolipin synthase-like enzyme